MTEWKLNKIIKRNCTQIKIFSIIGACWSALFRPKNRVESCLHFRLTCLSALGLDELPKKKLKLQIMPLH